MKTLPRWSKTLNANITLHYRHFSAEDHATKTLIANQGVPVSTNTTLHFFLQLCAKRCELVMGKACHAQVIHLGLCTDTITSNMLMNLYAKCGFIDSARKLFDKMPEKSSVSWNTMIGAYTKNGKEQESLSLFLEMQRTGHPFSEFTVSSVLCACASKSGVSECKQLHSFSIKAAMDANVFIGTALLDVYAKSGWIHDASRVFEGMSEKSVVTWSSMVAGYVQNELYDEALVTFARSQIIGLECTQFTLSSVICACAGLAALIDGKQMHSVVYKTGFGSNDFVAASLVDMYAKCGCIKDSYIVFLDVDSKNVVLWNVMISAFAKHSCSLEVRILFEKMQQMVMYPNEVTYVSVLSACSHMGLVNEGRSYFDLMTKEHNVSPNALHYSCMVDILGRAGLVHEAYELIKKTPFGATASMWGSLLACCRIYGNLGLAEIAAKNLFEMEPDNAGNYVLLSHTYAATKSWEGAIQVRKFLKENDVKKEKGKSWIEIKNRVHTFVVGERNHPRITDVYLELDNLLKTMKKLGYKVETDCDLHDVEETTKLELLRHHSEKLALTFGLICLPPNTAVRIMKNLRICGDCHSFMKLASRITGREIIVRDTKRFHHFKNGCCSCREFW